MPVPRPPLGQFILFINALLLTALVPAPPVLAGGPSAHPTTRPATQRAEVSVEFLDLNAARKAIVDESMEPYFKLLQPMEMSVKTGKPMGAGPLAQQRDECRERYQDAVQEFTDEEKQTLRWYVSKLAPLVAKYPVYARTPWSFIKLSADFEGGMPHTRGPHIVLSEDVLQPMVQMKKDVPSWLALAQFGQELLHEQSHVVQREHPELFARLYTQHWGFKHATSIQGCEWLTRHQLVNPDGVDVRWVFPIKEVDRTRWVWPLIVLGDVDDPAKATFADMRMVAIDVEPTEGGAFRAKVDAGGKPVMQDLLTVGQYAQVFRPSRNIYHPNEAAADLFAKIIVADKILPGNAPAEANEALANARTLFAPLKQWFEKILAGSHP